MYAHWKNTINFRNMGSVLSFVYLSSNGKSKETSSGFPSAWIYHVLSLEQSSSSTATQTHSSTMADSCTPGPCSGMKGEVMPCTSQVDWNPGTQVVQSCQVPWAGNADHCLVGASSLKYFLQADACQDSPFFCTYTYKTLKDTRKSLELIN